MDINFWLSIVSVALSAISVIISCKILYNIRIKISNEESNSTTVHASNQSSAAGRDMNNHVK